VNPAAAFHPSIRDMPWITQHVSFCSMQGWTTKGTDAQMGAWIPQNRSIKGGDKNLHVDMLRNSRFSVSIIIKLLNQ
jgi:hypothetical protein